MLFVIVLDKIINTSKKKFKIMYFILNIANLILLSLIFILLQISLFSFNIFEKNLSY